jgi:hypothetical protein
MMLEKADDCSSLLLLIAFFDLIKIESSLIHDPIGIGLSEYLQTHTPKCSQSTHHTTTIITTIIF